MSVTGNNIARAVAVMGLSDLETRVIKATYDDDDPPKQKHVDALLSYTHEYNIVPLIEKQLLEGRWRIVFKALCVTHRCSQDADARFLKNLLRRRQILDLQSWNDYNSTSGRQHVKYIRMYAAALLSKLQTYSLLGLSIERETPVDAKKLILQLTADDLTIKWLPILINQFDTILQCYPANQSDISHPITASSMSMLIKDAFRLYSVITVSFLQVLELFEKLNLEQLQATRTSLERFTSQNEQFKQWSEKLTRLGMIQTKVLPKFDAIPASFKDLVEERINKLSGGKSGKKASSKEERKKAKAKLKKKSRRNSDSSEDEQSDEPESESEEEVEVKPKSKRKGKKKPASSEEDSESENTPPVVVQKRSKAKSPKHDIAAQMASAVAQEDDEEEEELDSDEERARRKAKKKEKKRLRRLKEQQQQDAAQQQQGGGGGAFDLMQTFDPVLAAMSNGQQPGAGGKQRGLSNGSDVYSQLSQQQRGVSGNAMVPYGQQPSYNGQPQQQMQPYGYQPQQQYSPAPPAYHQSYNNYNQQPASYQPPQQQAGPLGAYNNPNTTNAPTPGNPKALQQQYDLMSAPQPNQAAVDGLFNVQPAAEPHSQPPTSSAAPSHGQPYPQNQKARKAAEEMFSDLL